MKIKQLIALIFFNALQQNECNYQSSKYLLNSPKCKIPNWDYFNSDVLPFMEERKYRNCSHLSPLTYISSDKLQQFYLNINNSIKMMYAPPNGVELSCCYRIIQRLGDNNYSSTFCIPFKNVTKIPFSASNILVKCKYNNKTVYSTPYYVFRRKYDLKSQRSNPEMMNMLLIGIDSMSRLNFHRTMPTTLEYLNNHNWFEMKVFNKVEDNTFPNIVALTTGLNITQIMKNYNPEKVAQLDKCPSFIWKYYQEAGYVTAYAEDSPSSGTFNYGKRGFSNQPTDHFLRPLTLAAEHYLDKILVDRGTYCLGSETYSNMIWKFTMNFLSTYENSPKFGFFFHSTFSHNEVNTPSMMDTKTLNWLEKFSLTSAFNKSVVIFFSDHGLRFGKVRETGSGWLEERLPFLFISIPTEWHKTRPQIVRNLKVNANRLITPFDLYVTMNHVLNLSGQTKNTGTSIACPNCQSIFNEISPNRVCEDLNIYTHWCACNDFSKKINNSSTIIQKAAQVFIKHLKSLIESNPEARKLCMTHELDHVISARIATTSTNYRKLYLLVIQVKPAGKYEATIEVLHHKNGTYSLNVANGISRIDAYLLQSECLPIYPFRLFCYCRYQLSKKGNSFLSFLNNIFKK